MKWCFISLLWYTSFIFAEPLQLKCEGIASKSTNSTLRVVLSLVTGAYGEGLLGNLSGKASNNMSVTTHLSDAENWIELPPFLQGATIGAPRILKGGNMEMKRYELKKVVFSESEINARFRMTMISNPKVRIDRMNGTLSIAGMSHEFFGNCEKVDLNKIKERAPKF